MKAEQDTSYKYVQYIQITFSSTLLEMKLGNAKSVHMCVIVHTIMFHYFLSAIPPSH